MKKALALLSIIAIAGCADMNGGGYSNLDPQSRAALIGALMNRPAPAQYQVPFYPMAIPQSQQTTCLFSGNLMSCN